MKNGKLFETVVGFIQESLKDSQNTTIRQNYKLLDNAGLNREFDIYISSIVNSLDVNIAVECKDYKTRKISIEKIEAFQTKCSDVPSIHKKIFISRNGFQSGATAKAKIYGIELLELNELDNYEFSKWFTIKNLRYSTIGSSCKNVHLYFKHNKVNTSDINQLEISFEQQKISLNEYVKALLREHLYSPRLYPINNISELEHEIQYNIDQELKNVHIIFEKEQYEISGMRLEMCDIIKPEHCTVSFDQYMRSEGNQLVAKSGTIVTDIAGIFSLVSTTGSDSIDIMYKKNGQNEKIEKIAKIKIEITPTSENAPSKGLM